MVQRSFQLASWEFATAVLCAALSALFLYSWKYVAGITFLYIVCTFWFPRGVAPLTYGLGACAMLWLASLAWHGDAFSRFAIGFIVVLNIGGLFLMAFGNRVEFGRHINAIVESSIFQRSIRLIPTAFWLLTLFVLVRGLLRFSDSPRDAFFALSSVPLGVWCCVMVSRLIAGNGRDRAGPTADEHVS